MAACLARCRCRHAAATAASAVSVLGSGRSWNGHMLGGAAPAVPPTGTTGRACRAISTGVPLLRHSAAVCCCCCGSCQPAVCGNRPDTASGHDMRAGALAGAAGAATAAGGAGVGAAGRGDAGLLPAEPLSATAAAWLGSLRLLRAKRRGGGGVLDAGGLPTAEDTRESKLERQSVGSSHLHRWVHKAGCQQWSGGSRSAGESQERRAEAHRERAEEAASPCTVASAVLVEGKVCRACATRWPWQQLTPPSRRAGGPPAGCGQALLACRCWPAPWAGPGVGAGTGQARKGCCSGGCRAYPAAVNAMHRPQSAPLT